MNCGGALLAPIPRTKARILSRRNSMLDRLVEWVVFSAQRQLIRRRFKATLGYAGDFENPKTYQEKVQFRKLYGNHAFYASVADKYRVRSYVAAKVGDKYLIPLLGAYDRLHSSVFDKLPEQFIIKANHGCKWHQVVYDKSKLDIDKAVRRFNKLCQRRFGWKSGERHYTVVLSSQRSSSNSCCEMCAVSCRGITASSAITGPVASTTVSRLSPRMGRAPPSKKTGHFSKPICLNTNWRHI